MDLAICFRCGASKEDALRPCPDCNALPSNDEEAALSLGLTTNHFGESTLEQFSRIIKDGQTPKLDPESRQALIEEVRRRREQENPTPKEKPAFEAHPVLEFGKDDDVETNLWLLLKPHLNLVTLQLIMVLIGIVMAVLSGVTEAGIQSFYGSAAVVCWVVVLFVVPCVAFMLPRIAGSYSWLVAVGVAGALAIPAAYYAPDLIYDADAVKEKDRPARLPLSM